MKARVEGGDKRGDVFLDNINRLFRFEREYDRKMITDEERTRRRQGLPTMEAMIILRANLLQELKVRRNGKLLYVGGPKLSSQVLEGILHLYKYKGRSLFDLEQSDREGSPFLYDQTQEFSALRKRRGNVDCHRIS